MKISIVIPVFNRPNEIRNTLNSVHRQSYKDWECLVVDDGSDVETINVINEIVALDCRIKLFFRPANRVKGANACRNIGVENAIGKYVAFLDSDDEWKIDRLRNLVKFIEKNTYPDGLYSGAHIYDGENLIKRSSRQIAASENIIEFTLSHETFSPTPSLVVKSVLGKRILFDEDLKRHQDFDFFIRFGIQYNWIFFDNDDIIINWIKGIKRNIDFESCINFYKKFQQEIDGSSIGKYYLGHMAEKAVKSSQKTEIICFYRNALKDIGFKFSVRDNFMYSFPKIFVLLYTWKKKLQ